MIEPIKSEPPPRRSMRVGTNAGGLNDDERNSVPLIICPATSAVGAAVAATSLFTAADAEGAGPVSNSPSPSRPPPVSGGSSSGSGSSAAAAGCSGSEVSTLLPGVAMPTRSCSSKSVSIPTTTFAMHVKKASSSSPLPRRSASANSATGGQCEGEVVPPLTSAGGNAFLTTTTTTMMNQLRRSTSSTNSSCEPPRQPIKFVNDKHERIVPTPVPAFSSSRPPRPAMGRNNTRAVISSSTSPSQQREYSTSVGPWEQEQRHSESTSRGAGVVHHDVDDCDEIGLSIIGPSSPMMLKSTVSDDDDEDRNYGDREERRVESSKTANAVPTKVVTSSDGPSQQQQRKKVAVRSVRSFATSESISLYDSNTTTSGKAKKKNSLSLATGRANASIDDDAEEDDEPSPQPVAGAPPCPEPVRHHFVGGAARRSVAAAAPPPPPPPAVVLHHENDATPSWTTGSEGLTKKSHANGIEATATAMKKTSSAQAAPPPQKKKKQQQQHPTRPRFVDATTPSVFSSNPSLAQHECPTVGGDAHLRELAARYNVPTRSVRVAT